MSDETIGVVNKIFPSGHRGPFIELRALSKYGGKISISLNEEYWEGGIKPQKEGQVVVVSELIRNRDFWEACKGRMITPEDDLRFKDEMEKLGITPLYKE